MKEILKIVFLFCKVTFKELKIMKTFFSFFFFFAFSGFLILVQFNALQKIAVLLG